MDIRAYLKEPVELLPGQRALIPTGIYLEIPEGYEVQIRARSGLAIKRGIGLVNGIGTIDSDYRGEVKIALINWGDEPFVISNGERVAQMVAARYEKVEFTGCRRAFGNGARQRRFWSHRSVGLVQACTKTVWRDHRS